MSSEADGSKKKPHHHVKLWVRLHSDFEADNAVDRELRRSPRHSASHFDKGLVVYPRILITASYGWLERLDF